ncbi:MAG: hypothetical protein LBO69_06810 [Ignavibacteria bacterium]|jgi:hypothetical protein|nr:hypothetical protein [Ignavibacteria bacterium]
MKTKLIAAIFFAIACLTANAQHKDVPIHNQLDILQGMLSMETTLGKKDVQDIVIGVVYQSSNATSSDVKNEIFSYIKNNKVKVRKIDVKFVPIDINKSNNITSALAGSEKCRVFIITPLKGANYSEIVKFSNTYSILTYSTCSKVMLQNNLSLSITNEKGKKSPLVNRKSLLTEGYNFPAQVLQYTNIVK